MYKNGIKWISKVLQKYPVILLKYMYTMYNYSCSQFVFV